MFSFLKKAARAAAAGASNLNIAVNTRTLLDTANAAQDRLDTSGGVPNARDKQSVHEAQKRLFDDIGLGLANGMSKDDVIATVHKATQQHDRITRGGDLALGHVLKSAFPE